MRNSEFAAEVSRELAQEFAQRKTQPECWNCLEASYPLKLVGPHLFCSICLAAMRREYDQADEREQEEP